MEQLHAHEVLHMMKGNSYSELVKSSEKINASILVRQKIWILMNL